MERRCFIQTFKEIEMRDGTKRALAEMDITSPTQVQEIVLPEMLAGKDCLVQSPTGTGKTFAFGIPILEQINVEEKSVQAVIVCPTRELADQTAKALKNLSKYIENLRIACVFGGQRFEKQLNALKRKPQIVVGTPGRMVDLIERKALRIRKANLLVLDEADEMLKMGFRDELNKIIEKMPKTAQKTFFSATIAPEIAVLSKSFQNNPVSLKATLKGSEMPEIKQYVVKLNSKKKFTALKNIIKTNNYEYILIFCNTKAMVDNLKDKFVKEGYNALGLHGDMIQRHRTRVMNSFRNKEINILIATDVAARGIDVDNIEAIFNYDIPMQPEHYVHRIGRTARANRTGIAYSLLTNRDIGKIKDIERETGIKMEEVVIDDVTDKSLSLKTNNGATTRLFMNVGTKDNLSNKKLYELLKNNCAVNEEQVQEIKLLEMFSFIEVDKEVAEVIKDLSGMTFCRRKLSIETAEKSGSRKNKSSQKRNYSKNKSNDYKKDYSSDRKSSGNYSSSRKSGDRKSSGNYSSDRKPGDRKSSGNWSSDRKPGDRKSSGNWSSDRKPGDRKSSGNWSSDRKSSDNWSSDRKSSDRKSSGNWSSDRKSSDRKSSDRKSSGNWSSDDRPNYNKGKKSSNKGNFVGNRNKKSNNKSSYNKGKRKIS